MTKKSYLTVTDQFCGAGGSSIGATAAGVELRLALNHWQLAIETHNSNFPNAMHDCTDISACDPRRYPSTDILITSPECTNHSLAKGKRRFSQPDLFGANVPDPAEERSRATMWDVPRFAEYHRYNAIIVENVVDARHWVTWDAWLHAMQLLGYEHQIVFFNSMFAWPTPQSRDRMYVIFSRKGNARPDLDFHPAAHCETCGKTVESVQSWKRHGQRWGRYGAQYVYRCPICAAEVKPFYNPAASAIDWTLPATRIGDRDKPLKAKTLERIQRGLDKYGRQDLIVANYTPGWSRPASDAPFGTITTYDHHALVVQLSYGGSNNRARSASEPMPTQTTRQDTALIMPYYSTGVAKPASEPVPTVTTTDRHALIVPPFLLGYYTRVAGVQAAVSGIDEPMPTQSTQPRHYLVQPGDVSSVEDCGFRMLRPHEIKAAMAFPTDYIVRGNNRDQVRQYGNAVTPPIMQMLIERVVAAL
ncbi:MAG: DNA cytosine methyltransferase [Vampirovibrionales bacterium]|nr:DNA cytosine methyltransferase [Vampirovibrionales bacterium]